MSARFLQTIVQTCALRQPLLWLTESQQLNLAVRCVIAALTPLHGYCASQHAGQLVPAYQRPRAHPQGTAPRTW